MSVRSLLLVACLAATLGHHVLPAITPAIAQDKPTPAAPTLQPASPTEKEAGNDRLRLEAMALIVAFATLIGLVFATRLSSRNNQALAFMLARVIAGGIGGSGIGILFGYALDWQNNRAGFRSWFENQHENAVAIGLLGAIIVASLVIAFGREGDKL
jgi:hypothetical protein